MAIQNVFANLADPKTMQDFQNEMLAQEMARQQLANAQIQNKASTLSLDEATRKSDINTRINQAGRQAITYDASGNPMVDNKKLTGLITEIDPLTGLEYGAKQAKSQADILKTNTEQQKNEVEIKKKQLENFQGFISTSRQLLNGATPQNFGQIKQQVMNLRNQLGIEPSQADIESWDYNQLPQLQAQGLTAEQKVTQGISQLNALRTQFNADRTYQLANKKEDREQAEFNLKQSGNLDPKEAKKQVLEFNKTFKNDYLEPFNKLKDKATQVTELLKTGKGIADTGALYTFLKVLDSAGAVTGSDYTAIRGVGGPIEKIQSLGAELTNNGILTTEKRNQLRDSINQILAVAENRLKQGVEDTKYQSDNFGLPLDQIIGKNAYEKFIGKINPNQDSRRNNPLGGLPNAPQGNIPNNPFSRNADVPPPQFTGIVDANGNVQTLGNKPQVLVPNLANKKFTDLPMQDRQLIQQRARQAGISPQDYYNGLQRFNQ